MSRQRLGMMIIKITPYPNIVKRARFVKAELFWPAA